MPTAKPIADLTQIFRIKVTLRGSQPVIWRRIEVPAAIALSDLHAVLQIVMGWTDSHLHHFYVSTSRGVHPVFYGMLDPDWDTEDTLDERRYALNQVVHKARQKLIYEYDFGDSWEHELLLEKVVAADPSAEYPRCLEGEYNGPPEDVGGLWGFANFVSIMSNPRHKEYAEMREWYGSRYDPLDFDLVAVNKRLKRIKPKRQLRGTGAKAKD